MESRELSKLSISRLKALANLNGVSLEGCVEKQHLVAALFGAGVTADVAKEDTDKATRETVAAAATPPASSSLPPAVDSSGDADRGALKRRVFSLWDADGDGFLKREEMLKVARCVGFDGSDEEWAEEYAQVCSDHRCSPSEGMSAAALLSLLDDKSETGCYLSNASLARILAAAGTEESQSCQNVPTLDRNELKRKVFRLWDQDLDGFLKEREMLRLAHCVGFEGPDEEFSAEYRQICEQRGCSPECGLSEAAIMALLDDESDTGCFISSEELREIAAATTTDARLPPIVGSRDAVSSSANGLALDRGALKRRAFMMWDADEDGSLNRFEMLQLARSMGFDGTDEEWAGHYMELCSQCSCSPDAGLPRDTVLELLDDESETGCFVPNDELARLLAAAGAEAGSGAVRATAPSPAPSPTPSPAPTPTPTPAATAASAQLGAPPGAPSGAGEPAAPEAAAAAPEAAAPEAAAPEAATPEAAAPEAAAAEAAAPEMATGPSTAAREGEDGVLRASLKHRVFLLWDQDGDGSLKKEELLKLARHVGFDGSVEEWSTEYAQMCTQRGCSARYGMSEEAFNEFLDDDSETGCYFSNEELAKIMAAADEAAAATKKDLIMLCNEDGSLKKDEMLKIAGWVGFDGSSEDSEKWCKEFAQVVADLIGSPSGGLSREAVMALAERTKAKMPGELFKKVESETGEGGAGRVSWRQKRQQKIASGDKKGPPTVVEPPCKKGRTVAPPSKAEIESAAEKRKRRCEGCETQPPALAVIRCVNCEAYLCAKCNDANHPTALLKKHTRQPLVQDGVDAYGRFRFLFSPGDQWQLTTSIALWRYEWGWEKIGGINATSPWGGPNAFQIMECGDKRLKVRGTRGGGQNLGWLDVNMLVDKQSGELMIRPLSQGQKP